MDIHTKEIITVYSENYTIIYALDYSHDCL